MYRAGDFKEKGVVRRWRGRGDEGKGEVGGKPNGSPLQPRAPVLHFSFSLTAR